MRKFKAFQTSSPLWSTEIIRLRLPCISLNQKKTLFIDEKVLITETQPTLKIVYPVLSVEEITW